MKNVLMTICFAVVVMFAIIFASSCKKEPEKQETYTITDISREESAPNDCVEIVPYDYENDPNLPMELKEKIGSMLVGLNTCNVDLFFKDIDLHAEYDLVTKKTSLPGLNSWFSDWKQEWVDSENTIFEDPNIKSFEDYNALLYEDISKSDAFDNSKPKRNFHVTSVSIDTNNRVFHIKLKEFQGLSIKTKWVYYNQKWCVIDYKFVWEVDLGKLNISVEKN